MNYLKDVISLKNRYFAMRHGQSEINVLHILVTDPANGINGYGLTELGKKQVEESVLNNKLLDKETIIYTSDFKRARETAEVARDVLKAKPVNLEKKLRERGFGIFEKTSSSNYAKVWAEDEINPDSKRYGNESANELLTRVTSLIPELEKKYSEKNILLISHGDPLQLLNIGFMKRDASQHTKLKFFDNAEIRELKLKK
jgi:broad specificity phosphatase PhoE